MIPSKSDAYKYALCMELRTGSFSYAIINEVEQKVVFSKKIEFKTLSNENLNRLLDAAHFDLEYKSISVSISTDRTTLVPDSIFNTSDPKDIFKLNHIEPIDNIEYARIPELGIVTIYELPNWIKTTFVKRFLKIKIVHHSSVLLKGIFNKPSKLPAAHVFKEEDLFYLVLTEQGKLNYFNLFKSSEINDLVYYYLFVLDQKELDPDTIPLHVYGIKPTNKIIGQLNNLLSKPSIVHSAENQQSHFILTNQLLCV